MFMHGCTYDLCSMRVDCDAAAWSQRPTSLRDNKVDRIFIVSFSSLFRCRVHNFNVLVHSHCSDGMDFSRSKIHKPTVHDLMTTNQQMETDSILVVVLLLQMSQFKINKLLLVPSVGVRFDS